MADAVKRLSVRLSVDGAQEAKTKLQDFARSGEESMARVGARTRESSLAMDSFGRSANDNAPRLSRFGDAFDTAEGKIKGTLRGINDVRGAIDLIAPGASAATSGLGALAVTIGNLSDVAGTLASVFLRNPLGLIAIGVSAAAVAYLTLRTRIDETVKAEEAYQNALAATNPLIEEQIDATRRLAIERSKAAGESAAAGIAAQEAEIKRASVAIERLQKSLERLRAAQERAPGNDLSAEIAKVEESIGGLNAIIGNATVKIDELRIRSEATTVTSLDLSKALSAVRTELAGFDTATPVGIEKLNADFERVKAVLDAGLAEGLRLTAEQYEKLLDVATRRKDLGIAAILEAEAARVKTANDELYASLQESIDRYNELANARQRAGADIEAQIDSYYREADATRAGALGLQFYRQELERQKVGDDARKRARDAFGDDAAAVDGDVARVLKAYDDLQLARAEATGKATDQTNDLARSLSDGLSKAFDSAGRSSAKMLADVTVGLNTANFSVARLMQTLASDVISKMIQEQITGPLAKFGGSFLDNAFGSLFGGSSGTSNYFGGATPDSSALSFGGPRAGGGDVGPNKFYLVGEEGPELVEFGSTGRVIPTDESMSMMSSRRGGEARVTFVLNDNRAGGTSEPVRSTTSRGPNGDTVIEAWINDKVDARLKQNLASGAIDRQMGAAYGTTRKPFVRS